MLAATPHGIRLPQSVFLIYPGKELPEKTATVERIVDSLTGRQDETK